jgi:ATP-dependent Lhr-like helicase
LRPVRWVIIDEVHELAEDERGAQLSIGLERLTELAGDFQRIGLSATVGSPNVVAQFLVGTNRQVEIIDASVAKEMKVRVESPMPTKDDVELSDKLFAEPTMVARLRRLRELTDKHTSVLTFVNTREAAETLGSRMRMWDAGYPVAVHHGSLAKEVRIEAEEKFRNAKLKCLICTSSMELGIDIGAVDLVAQYMSPRQVTRLVQRVGRSGHKIGELSQGIVLAANPDDVVEATVIAKRALTGKLEQTKVQEKSLDVLAHQLVGLSLDASDVSLDAAHALITRAYPYRNLSKDELISVLQQLKARGLVWVKDGKFERRRPGWEYYFTNLSMIPDTKRYRIYDIASRRSIGTLDEEFVAGAAEPEMSFICKGEAWKIVSIEEDRVLVEPMGDPLGAIPAWEGELNPVPFEVAQEVGKIRGEAWKRLKAGASAEKVASELCGEYPVEEKAAAWFVRQMEEQSKESQSLPTDNQLVVEAYEQFAVLHACFGSIVNETLARVLAALLSSKFGASVGVKVDPYRIAFKFPLIAKPELLEQSLTELEPEHVEGILQLTLGDSSMFRWRLIHVAKRFGAIKRDADLSRMNLRRVARAFEDTPVHAETMREIYLEKLDVENTKKIVGLIQAGTVKLSTITRMRDEGPTPLGWPVLNELASAGELVVPKRAEREILMALKARLHHKEVKIGRAHV